MKKLFLYTPVFLGVGTLFLAAPAHAVMRVPFNSNTLQPMPSVAHPNISGNINASSTPIHSTSQNTPTGSESSGVISTSTSPQSIATTSLQAPQTQTNHLLFNGVVLGYLILMALIALYVSRKKLFNFVGQPIDRRDDSNS